MSDLSSSDVLCKLQDVATDDEADMIERLAIKAGFWWKCPECWYVNLAGENRCEGCGRKS